jgi:xanthine dehydrogenase accessory factor
MTGRGMRRAVATLVASQRSAPRPIGSQLVVSESGELTGSISGGCVESDVFEAACEVLAGGPPRLMTYGIADELAWSVGLPCGGEIDVFVELEDAVIAERVARARADDERLVVLTVVDGTDVGAKELVLESGERLGRDVARSHGVRPAELIRGARSRIVELEGARVFAQVVATPPLLLVFGAVDTAEELCRAAKALGWRTAVADPRGSFATRERMPSADDLVLAWPEEALERLRPDHSAAVVCLFHDEKLDVPAIKGTLATDAFYLGAIGSRRTQASRRAALLDAGVDEEELDRRLSGPCGLDLGGETPAEVALAILAEILAVRNDRAGGRLRDVKGRAAASA